jgi:hypothetical protein
MMLRPRLRHTAARTPRNGLLLQVVAKPAPVLWVHAIALAVLLASLLVSRHLRHTDSPSVPRPYLLNL